MILNNQFYLFIHTVLYGIFLGLLFDTLSIVLKRVNQKFIRDLLMVIYWVLQIPFAFAFFHQISQGELQSYLVVFLLLGGLIYFKGLRYDYVLRLREFKVVCHQIDKFIKKVLNVLIFRPLAFIFKLISAIIVIPKRFFKKIRTNSDNKELKDEEIQSNEK